MRLKMNYGSATPTGFTQGKWTVKDELETLGFNVSPIDYDKDGNRILKVSETITTEKRGWTLKMIQEQLQYKSFTYLSDTKAKIIS